MGFLGLVLGFWSPVIFPAKSVEKLLEEFAAIDMFHAAHAGDKTFDVAFAVSTEFVGGAVAIIAGAFAGNDESGVDDGADEWHAFVDRLLVLFLGMKSEAELAKEKFADDFDVAEKLSALMLGDDNEEVVDVATVMLIAEVETDETIKLVEEDVGEELRSEVADDDAAAMRLSEETLRLRKGAPVGTASADGDVFHGFVVDNFAPEIFKDIVEPGLVGGVTTDTVFCVGATSMIELLLEPPENAFVEFVMI